MKDGHRQEQDAATMKISSSHINWLVASNIFYFPFHLWDVILPIDELIFFRGVAQPPTRINSWYTHIFRVAISSFVQFILAFSEVSRTKPSSCLQ
jgi:membrane protease YdiL (CAAX protease family)